VTQFSLTDAQLDAIADRLARSVSLTEEQIDAIADRLLARLAGRVEPPASPTPPRRLVDAAELASILGVSRWWVYQHAEELGAIRLGTRREDERLEAAGAADAEGEASARDQRRRGGPPLRFEAEAAATLAAQMARAPRAGRQSPARNPGDGAESELAPARPRRRRASPLPQPGSVLAIRGPSPTARHSDTAVSTTKPEGARSLDEMRRQEALKTTAQPRHSGRA
jgi:hypothetical protein